VTGEGRKLARRIARAEKEGRCVTRRVKHGIEVRTENGRTVVQVHAIRNQAAKKAAKDLEGLGI
jgi:hypothetical protein